MLISWFDLINWFFLSAYWFFPPVGNSICLHSHQSTCSHSTKINFARDNPHCAKYTWFILNKMRCLFSLYTISNLCYLHAYLRELISLGWLFCHFDELYRTKFSPWWDDSKGTTHTKYITRHVLITWIECRGPFKNLRWHRPEAVLPINRIHFVLSMPSSGGLLIIKWICSWHRRFSK